MFANAVSAVRKSLFTTSILLGLMLTPFAAHAIEINGIAKLGLDFGGDSMVKVIFTSGNSS